MGLSKGDNADKWQTEKVQLSKGESADKGRTEEEATEQGRDCG
ncbi:hypothetical protein J19TS2_15690 [Cohnella xylanilytica]|nr:hypothetical protein J19TS2_15690 [Cohnella xylanilytica]